VTGKPITAIILVQQAGGITWYVKRSPTMANYPDVWSLPSIQYDPVDFEDPNDLQRASELANALSAQRLGGIPVKVLRFLTEGTSDMNPMGVDVTLRLYEIDLMPTPELNPEFYVDQEWMSPERYQEASTGQPCGLCLRLWSDFAWLSGITDRPYVPTVADPENRRSDEVPA